MIDFVAGTYVDLRRFLASLKSCLGASGSFNDPGPMLLLLPFLAALRGEELLYCSGSLDVCGATFSLFSGDAMSMLR